MPPLTLHQRFHVQAVRTEAALTPNSQERSRILMECDDLLEDRVVWPDSRIDDARIADWIEKPDERIGMVL